MEENLEYDVFDKLVQVEEYINNLKKEYQEQLDENLKMSEWLVEKQHRIEELQKENEELSRLNEKLEMEYNILLNAKVAIDIGSTESVGIEFLEEYIPKSVIQDKIDVLEKIQKEFKNNEELRIKIITHKELLNKEE